MRKIYIGILVLVLTGCGISEDCIKSSGRSTVRNFAIDSISKVFVEPGIALVVRQGESYELEIWSGENIMENIEVGVQDHVLRLRDKSSCNLSRAYGVTTAYLTAPNIEEIYSNTEQTISSDGVLTYPVLRLISMDFFGGVGTGDFVMNIENEHLVVQSNHVAGFYITGNTGLFLLHFYDGIGRFHGAGFVAQEIEVFHRGSNDLIVHPVQKLSGNLYSTGDLISVNVPFEPADVQQHYSGSLRFE